MRDFYAMPSSSFLCICREYSLALQCQTEYAVDCSNDFEVKVQAYFGYFAQYMPDDCETKTCFINSASKYYFVICSQERLYPKLGRRAGIVVGSKISSISSGPFNGTRKLIFELRGEFKTRLVMTLGISTTIAELKSESKD